MSSRAAWRLETLGFDKVYYYKPGKVDWLACGLPVEKEPGEALTVLETMTREFPSCRLSDSRREAKERAEKLGLKLCPVVNEQGIALGLVAERDWRDKPESPVEPIMQGAPTTLRPNHSVRAATELLDQRQLPAVLITTPDGKLIGIFTRQATAKGN